MFLQYGGVGRHDGLGLLYCTRTLSATLAHSRGYRNGGCGSGHSLGGRNGAAGSHLSRCDTTLRWQRRIHRLLSLYVSDSNALSNEVARCV